MQSVACFCLPQPAAGRAADPVRFAPTVALTLPRLATNIPKSLPIDDQDRGDHIGNIALALAKADVLTPEHWDGDAVSSCCRAVAKHTHGFEAFDMHVEFMSHLRRLSGFDFGYTDKFADLGGFALTVGKPEIYTCNRKLKNINDRCPGLGAAVISVLDSVDFSIFTPTVAFMECDWFHWRGEGDEVKGLALMKEEDPDEDEIEIAIKRADWDKEMPRWVYQRTSLERTSLERLKVLARKARIPKLTDPLIALKEMLQGRPKDDHTYGPNVVNQVHGYNNVTTPVIVEWRACGIVGQIFDDVYNDAFQAGASNLEHCAVIPFKPEDPESVRTALRQLDGLLQQMTLVHEILPLIGTSREVQWGPVL